MRLRAPRDDRAILAEPSLAEAGKLIEANRRSLDNSNLVLLDRSLPELRREGQRTALEASTAYFRQTREPLPCASGDSLLLAGHQPELFHPGVWVKNSALNSLARRHGAVPLNLVVDSDAPGALTLRLPCLQPRPRLVQVPFDHWYGEIPYEERAVQNEALFAEFPDRVRDFTKDWPFEPMLPVLWADMQREADRSPLLGQRIVSARRSLERNWNCHNLEAPLSMIMASEPAGRFICHVLANAAKFQAIYNEVVRSYRRREGLKSRNHPVPDLARDGDWLEAPFWAWQSGQKRRRRLFVRPGPDRIELRAGVETWPTLSSADPVRDWSTLVTAGYKIRTRALTTTLFARLILGDLFIHGIGGAIYDELTDEIMRRFYAIEPPRFLVLSATLRLPFPRAPIDQRACSRLGRELRDLRWNPQRHLDGIIPQGDVDRLAAQKRAWIARESTSAVERRQRYEALRSLTCTLEAFLKPEEQVLKEKLKRTCSQVQADAVLYRRDFAFCLYPEKVLRDFCTQFLE